MNHMTDRQIARFVDGEMAAAEREQFERQMRNDKQLAAAVAAAAERSRAVRSALPEPARAPAGFGTAVIDKIRRMPSREDLVRETAAEETVAAVVRYGQRLLVAALLIFGVALLFSANLLRTMDSAELKADPALMQQLDEKIKKMKERELLRRRPR